MVLEGWGSLLWMKGDGMIRLNILAYNKFLKKKVIGWQEEWGTMMGWWVGAGGISITYPLHEMGFSILP